MRKIRHDREKRMLFLEIDRSEIYHSIKFEAYLYAQFLRLQGKDMDLQSYITDICEEQSKERTARNLELSLADVKVLISKLTRYPHPESVCLDNDYDHSVGNPDNNEEICIILAVPPSFNDAMAEPIYTYICDYLVKKTIKYHLDMFFPEGAAVYETYAQTDAEKIHQYSTVFIPGSLKLGQTMF